MLKMTYIYIPELKKILRKNFELENLVFYANKIEKMNAKIIVTLLD